MQALRDLLRSSLGKALSGLEPLDRLASAWPVAAGHAIAERSAVVRLEGSVAMVEVAGGDGWVRQLREMTPQLRGDLAKVSGVALTDILFVPPGSPRSSRAYDKPRGRS